MMKVRLFGSCMMLYENSKFLNSIISILFLHYSVIMIHLAKKTNIKAEGMEQLIKATLLLSMKR
jgi:hypothetical protein